MYEIHMQISVKFVYYVLVLVTFLFLWLITKTTTKLCPKATHENKSLFGFIVTNRQMSIVAGKHGNKKQAYWRNKKQRSHISTMKTRQRDLKESDIGLFISKHVFLSARLHHVRFLKQGHQLGTECPNDWDWGDIMHLNRHGVWLLWALLIFLLKTWYRAASAAVRSWLYWLCHARR